jgi:hypothetical protein
MLDFRYMSIRRVGVSIAAIVGLAVGTAVVFQPLAASAAPVTTAPITPDSVASVAVSSQVSNAVAYADSRGYSTGVSVLDTKTGRYWGSNDLAIFPTESVVKTMIATYLLATGQMHGAIETTAYKMITQSDDESADTLWGLTGPNVITWVANYYHIPYLGYPPSMPGWWGNTHITSRGMVAFYQHAKADSRVGPWLFNAMHHATVYGSDGTYQFFGIPSATTGAAIKQGWGGDDDAMAHADFNSTGLVDGDRYAIAILTSGPPSSYGATISSILSGEARTLMPGGQVVSVSHNPTLHIDGVSTTGSVVHILGWAYDPDDLPGTVAVQVREGSKLRAAGRANLIRADVARSQKIHGAHGLSLSFGAGNGIHRYCITVANVGSGTAPWPTCVTVTVNGDAKGTLETASANANSVTLTGWTLDPGNTSASAKVLIKDGTTTIGTYNTTVPRSDVNRVFRVIGRHGFADTLTDVPAGTHRYCAYAVDMGSAQNSPAVAIGCQSVTVG